MKIMIESFNKLSDNDLEEIVGVWNRKRRRITVELGYQTHALIGITVK